MEWLELIIKIGGAVGAVIAIWKGMASIVRSFDGMKKEFTEIKEHVMKNIKNVESIPSIEEHCRENYLTGLRLTIMSDDMPLGERIAAGVKYLNSGGNGEVKKFLINELHINDVQKD